MTIGEIENRVRMKLLDTYSDKYHFSPSEVFHAMRDGMWRIWSVCPSSRYVDGVIVDKMLIVNGTETDFVTPESFPAMVAGAQRTLDEFRGFQLNMEDRYSEPLMYYVIHQMFLKDDPDTANATLAQTYFNKFTESVNG